MDLNELNTLALPVSDFVERMGILFEEDGFPRTAGRIFGLLLLSPHPLSLDELAERLAVSKASVSIEARRLAHHGIVERVGMPGDRRDYYRTGPDALARSMRLRLETMQRYDTLLADGLASPASEDPLVRERLTGIQADAREVIRVLGDLIARSSARSAHQTV